ncbi:MAG: ribosome small subunit-dependent GTPase A [Candidatus Cryptobacteroides sp.]
MTRTEATVVKNSGSLYYLSCLPQWRLFPAVLRGKVRLSQDGATNPVAVGDRVLCEWESTPDESAPARITEILPRENHLIRKSTNLSRKSHVIAANIDRAFLVCSLYFPELKYPFLDRQLVGCEMFKIPVSIVLNKLDLYGEEAAGQVEEFKRIYASAGYQVIECSVKTGQGIEEIRRLCAGENGMGINLLSGESGVGKSSIIKLLDPSLSPKIGQISLSHLQGKHTTSLYEMYPIASGGCLIDSPGLRGFGLYGLEKEEVAKYFPEMLALSDECRYVPCTHTHEPACAVKAAVEDGKISESRYASYLGMLEEDSKFR